MEDIQLIDAVERYIRGEMTGEELAYFEQLRKSNADVDQLVVEHTIFLQQLNEYGDRKQLKAVLNETHNHLTETGDIRPMAPKGKVVEMIRKYRKVWAVAASIAGFIAITVSGLITYFAPHNGTDVQYLSGLINKQNDQINNQQHEIQKMKSSLIPAGAEGKTGTAFLIDGRGYLLTNAHVVKDVGHIVIQGSKGQEYNVDNVYTDVARDLAVLKIKDNDSFKTVVTLPYGFRRGNTDLGEQIFTLGYPRDEIVYGEGYMSAKTGYNGDTLSCQIEVAANPGNSGGPVFNKNGEVIGILTTKQRQVQGFVFAVTTRNIFRTLDEMKKDSTLQSLRLNFNTQVKGMERPLQIKKIEDCVFHVKTYN